MVDQRRDDPVTFEEYVAGRSVALQKFAWLVTRDREEARDCVQDALLGLYPRWDRVRAVGGVDAYVRRSIVNASVSRWRKRHGTLTVADPTDGPDAPVVADHATGVADADEALRLCVELPVDQRAAVVMRFYDDLSFAQIGEALGCTESTARSHVHRALGALRQRLRRGEHDD